jgi:CRP/FNR family transcriptional regulator
LNQLIDEIKDVGILMEVADGHDLIKPGQYIKSMPLLSGSIKILRPDAYGDELLLYYLEKEIPVP